MELHMEDTGPTTTRRALLGAITAAPLTVLPVETIAAPWGDALHALHARYGDAPAKLHRTRDGRSLSRARYHTAEEFFVPVEAHRFERRSRMLYNSGIVAQLALSSHLLDVGFDDEWCARHIGYRVAHALAYANATGFGHDCPDMAELAIVLTPYWKWNKVHLFHAPPPIDTRLSSDRITGVLRGLLERVHQVTGHTRPRGWGMRHAASPHRTAAPSGEGRS